MHRALDRVVSSSPGGPHERLSWEGCDSLVRCGAALTRSAAALPSFVTHLRVILECARAIHSSSSKSLVDAAREEEET